MATAAAAAAGLGDLFSEPLRIDDDLVFSKSKKSASPSKAKKSSPSRSGPGHSSSHPHGHHHQHHHQHHPQGGYDASSSSPSRQIPSRPPVAKEDKSRWLSCFCCSPQTRPTEGQHTTI